MNECFQTWALNNIAYFDVGTSSARLLAQKAPTVPPVTSEGPTITRKPPPRPPPRPLLRKPAAPPHPLVKAAENPTAGRVGLSRATDGSFRDIGMSFTFSVCLVTQT